MGKQNMAMFENAMRMFNPFQRRARRAGKRTGARRARHAARHQRPGTAQVGHAGMPANDAAIDDLKRKLDELQNQLAELSKKS